MMTNKELSLKIRKELKEKGYGSKDLKVCVKDCGYSTSINVTIKSAHINKKDIKELLEHHVEYEIDNRTYEILQGGNTYLFVDYEHGIFEEVSQEWAPTVIGLMKSKDKVIRIFDGLFLHNNKGQMEIMQQNEKEHSTRIVYGFNHLCELLYKFAEFGSIGI